MSDRCTQCGGERPVEGPCPSCPNIPGVEVLSRVGEGGMGVVYAARQPDLNRRVAVKVLRSVHAGDPSFVLRFLEEARAAAKISHPNVVAIYDVGRENESCYIVMEYIEGESLDKILKRGRLPLETAVSYMTQALKAASGIHQQAVLHGDIKPSNLMIQPDGRVKLVDFGLARPTREESTAPGAMPVGTPKYISPEQARGEAIDERSDLYCLGVLFYEMLAGRHPCEAATPNAFLLWHASRETRAVPLRRAAPGVPERICGVVDRLIEKDPDRRLPSAEAALHALQHGLPRRVSWRGGVASAVSLAVLSLAALPYLLRTKSQDRPAPRPESRAEVREAPRESAAAAAARRLRLHWEGTAFLTPGEIRQAVAALAALPDDPASRETLQAFEERAAGIESESDAALRQSNLELAEQKARLLERDYPVEPWPGRARVLLARIRGARTAPAKTEPEPEVAVSPDSVFGSPRTIDLPFVAAEGVFSTDSKGLLLLDKTAGALVLYSLEERKEIRRVPVESDPVRIAKRGGTVYLACRSGSVVAVDEASMTVQWTTPILDGRPTAIRAPEQDAGRVYAADGDYLYAIEAATGKIDETVPHQRRTTPSRDEANQPVELVAHPGGARFFVWRVGVSSSENCAQIDRGADGKLIVRERFGDPGPVTFDPHGQYLLHAGALYEPARRVKYADLAPRTAYGFHPDLPWAVGVSVTDGRPSLFDLHGCAPVALPDSGMRLSVRWSSVAPDPYALLLAPDASKAVLMSRMPYLNYYGYEPSAKIEILPLRRAKRGRLACGALPPETADVGFATTFTIPGEATVVLEGGPEGMSYDASKRVLSWTPGLPQLGTHDVRLGFLSGDFATTVRFRIEARLRTIVWKPWDDPDTSGPIEARVSGDGNFLCARGMGAPRVLLYDLASGALRSFEAEDPVHDMVDVGDDLYIQVPGKILVTRMSAPGPPTEPVATLDLEFMTLHGLRSGGGSLFLFVKKDAEFRCLKIVPGEPSREVLRETDYFPLWIVDPDGRRLIGVRSRSLHAIRMGERDPEWSRKLTRAPTLSLRWMPDGKRLCVDGDIVSAEDGSVLQTFENATVVADPEGEFLAVRTPGEIALIRDVTYEVLDRLKVSGGATAVPLRKHGQIVLLENGRFSLLPYDFARLKKK